LININGFGDVGEGTKTRVPVQLNLQTDETIHDDVLITRIGVDNPRVQTISECQESMKKINQAIENDEDPPFLGYDSMLQYSIKSEFCHNITVIDTPGLRIAEYKVEVEEIIKDLLLNLPDSYILVLQSPEEDWDNVSPAYQIIESDPNFKKRAIVVRTKLSLKLQQLGDENEINNFFKPVASSWSGWLSPPFFVDCGERMEIVNLKGNRSLTSLLNKVDKKNLDKITPALDGKLLSIVKEHLGVPKLREFLQMHLTAKLTSGGGGFLSVISKKIRSTEEEKATAEKRLNEIDGKSLFIQLVYLKTSWWNAWKALLKGVAKEKIIQEFGLTLNDEKNPDQFGLYIDARSNPLNPDTTNVLGADYKEVGGPQLKRTIAEFYEIARLIAAEAKDHDAVLNTLQPGSIHNSVEIMNACSQIVCEKARIELKPLVQQLVERCSKVMMRMPGVCARVVMEEAESKNIPLQSIEPFWKWLDSVANEFITLTTKRCLEATKFDFWGATEFIETEDDYVVKEDLDKIKAEVDQQKPPDSDKRATEQWAIESAAKIVPLLFRVLVTDFFKTVKRKLHVFFLLSFEERAPEPEYAFISYLDIKFHDLRDELDKIFNIEEIQKELADKIVNCTEKLEQLKVLYTDFQNLNLV